MKEITNYRKGDKLPEELLQLYIEAFPADERRPWQSTEELIVFADTHPEMKIRLITVDGKFAGLMIFWELDDSLRYIEHLATLPELRGQGLGKQLMDSLKDEGASILLEVEPPVDELTRRRVNFYRRLGLELHEALPYLQPPYAEGLEPVALGLMTTPEVTDTILSDIYIPLLWKFVYDADF